MMLLCLILLAVLPVGQTNEEIVIEKLSCFEQLEETFDDHLVYKCPAGCCDGCRGHVYGDGPYHFDSSACCAALHGGCYKDKTGGYVTFKHVAGELSYKGSKQNSIESVECGGSDWAFECESHAGPDPCDCDGGDADGTPDDAEDNEETDSTDCKPCHMYGYGKK